AVDSAEAVEVPVAVAVRLPGGDECRIGPVEDRPQVLLRPEEDAESRRAEARQVRHREAPRHVPAVDLAVFAAAAGAGEAVFLAFGHYSSAATGNFTGRRS